MRLSGMRHSRHRCGPPLAELTLGQRMELLLGPGPEAAFASEADRRLAWNRHRAALLALEPAGRRPWAARFYDDVTAARPEQSLGRRPRA